MTLNYVGRPTGDTYYASGQKGPDLRFKIGSTEVFLDTATNSEWKTIEIDVSSLSSTISGIQLYGRYHATGLYQGDAVYIQSIEFLP